MDLLAILSVYVMFLLAAFTMISDTIITKQGKDTLAGLPAHQLLSTSTRTEHREDASIYNSKQQYCLSGYIWSRKCRI